MLRMPRVPLFALPRRSYRSGLSPSGRRPSGGALRRGLHVLQHPHPALRQTALPVGAEQFRDGSLHEVAEAMVRLMIEHDGVGLAAPQLGLPLRLIVINPSATGSPPHLLALANPTLLGAAATPAVAGEPGVEVGAEACLSIADVEGDVPRWQHVRCSAQTLDGERVELSASHFAARLLQHEIDHLDGVLFIDRVAAGSPYV